jgi:hypothetical protein
VSTYNETKDDNQVSSGRIHATHKLGGKKKYRVMEENIRIEKGEKD